MRNRNGVGILVDDELRKQVVEVKRVNDRMMSIKLVIGGSSWNIFSMYAPHISLDDEEKKKFWEDLDEMVRSVPSNEKFFIEGDFNGHIGSSSKGYDDVHGGHGFDVRNVEGATFLDFSRAFRLVLVNSNFPKKEVYLVTFYNSVFKT
ncbi:craniofacial development protein 2-like [Capsicum annuum]|uniref:craniofacial development protein 2-like n=1 Tax=Capsicum annuum TaxID=4072 RepID=UPI001FB1920F|nr:craniofacial development protein 2-like [Capsicum annuum]